MVSESGLWNGPGVRVDRDTLKDPARNWYQRTVEYPIPPHIGGTTDLTYILYNHGGGARFLTRGVPRVGYYVDGATRALHSLPHLGLYDNCGGEQPTPPMVSPM